MVEQGGSGESFHACPVVEAPDLDVKTADRILPECDNFPSAAARAEFPEPLALGYFAQAAAHRLLSST